MKKIITKKTKRKIRRYYVNSIRIICLVIPSLLFYFILFFLGIELIQWNNKEYSLRVYQSIVIITMSFAALTFTYARTVKGNKKKFQPLVHCGERFLQAAIYSLFAFIFVYVIKGVLFSCKNIVCISINFFLGMVSIWLIFMAVLNFDYAIKKIWKIAHYDFKYSVIDNISDNWRWK